LKHKIGIGYDVHRLVRGRPLYVGGVEVPADRGALGHSDGDCLIHALIDALLGAMGRGDIGRLFPDTDPRYKGVRSTRLLRNVAGRLRRGKFKILNVDAVIVLERPKLGPYIKDMKRVLAEALGLDEDDVGLKAKTNEGLGPMGRGRAIACWAAALIKK
jgi:2-C-methyl-D-erythritol 2,4-cyclodiphosphate synthase